MAAAASLPHLQQLQLPYCWRVTDSAVQRLAAAARSLRSLDLTHCCQVSRTCLAHLLQRKPLLELQADGCSLLLPVPAAAAASIV